MHASRTFSKFQRRTNIALSEKTLQSFMVKSDIIVPRCLDELFPFRRKNAFDVLSSILEIVFNRGSVITVCGTCVSIVVNFAGSTFYADVANFQMEIYIFFFFLSADSYRGER